MIRFALLCSLAVSERCRFTIPVEIDSARVVKYVVYEEGAAYEAVASRFCAGIGAAGPDCERLIAGAVAKRAAWQCDRATHPHAPRSLVEHASLGDIDYAPAPRFDAGDPRGGLAFLGRHGYAVFASAAPPAAASAIEASLWDFFEERFAPLDRRRMDTWDLLPANEYGILLLYGVGQSEAMWRVRELPAVRGVFAGAWNDTDLVCDFGGPVVFRPARCTDRWRTPERWFHVDQNARTYDGFHSLQGFLCLTKNDASTGGLVVAPGSREDHANVSARAAEWWGVRDPDHQFLLLAPDDAALRGVRPRFVGCEAGDLVVWDSRLAHANTNARPALSRPRGDAPPPPPDENWFADDADRSPKQRRAAVQDRLGGLAGYGHFPLDDACAADADPRLQRAVALVSMSPRSKVPEAVLEKRKRAYVNEQTTSHWPIRFDADAPVAKRTKSDADLTPLRRWLVGYRGDDGPRSGL